MYIMFYPSRVGFYIPELNIMLDAGPTSSKNPDHVFITHNHVDHVAGVRFYTSNVTPHLLVD